MSNNKGREKRTDLPSDAILSLKIFTTTTASGTSSTGTGSSNSNSRNVLTVYSDGRVAHQPGFYGSHQVDLNLDLEDRMTAADYLEKHLPIEAFKLALANHPSNYYEIPSPPHIPVKSSTSIIANLYIRVKNDGSSPRKNEEREEEEHWLAIGNYGRGEIPPSVDGNMFKAVLKLEEYLTEG